MKKNKVRAGRCRAPSLESSIINIDTHPDSAGIVVPGEYFFFGDTDDSWRHPHECLRISFAMADADVQAGLEIIAEEIAEAY